MKAARVSILLALTLLLGSSAYALDTKCMVVGPAASDLSLIAREAAEAQKQADEIEAYLRNSSPNWQSLAYKMAYLEDNIRNLRKWIADFERREPRLNDAQSRQLERLKTGLATLTVFANNTNRLIAEKQLLPHRDSLVAHAKAMSVRAGIVRDAARSLRIVESA
jgi:chromosome segregation ATPase